MKRLFSLLTAFVLAAALCISVGAAAICKWGGFALTGSMSEGEKMALLEKVAALPGGVEVRDEDGTVHYLDETGKEVLVLSAQEAAKHEQELLRAQEQTVRESTALVDADTLPPELAVTARTQESEVMAVQHKIYPIYGVQFHPESIMTPDGKTMLRNFIKEI